MALVEPSAGAQAEARYRRRSSLACILAGGCQDSAQAKGVAAAWFDTEQARSAAHARAETIAGALVRSPTGWVAIRAVASAVLDRGRIDGDEIDGDEIDVLCAAAVGQPFRHGAWDGAWPPTSARIRAGVIPERASRQAA